MEYADSATAGRRLGEFNMSLYPDLEPRYLSDPLGRDEETEDPDNIPVLQPITIRPIVADIEEWKTDESTCPF